MFSIAQNDVARKRVTPSPEGNSRAPLSPTHNPLWDAVATSSHAAGPPWIQPKLAISQPGDPYEQEADRVADRVMRMPELMAQRKCAACTGGAGPCLQCAAEQETPIHRKADAVSGAADSSDASSLISHLGPGKPLDPGTRAFFEPRFGQNLSHVCVHTGDVAQQSAREVNALAYTVGSHVVFGGRYAPDTSDGKRLLAHELTHVVQQDNFRSWRGLRIGLDHSVGDADAPRSEAFMSNNLQTSNLSNLSSPEPLLRRAPRIDAGEGTTAELNAERERLVKEMQSASTPEKSKYQQLIDKLDLRISERGDSLLKDCPIELLFNGKHLRIVGKVSKMFPAVSGRPIKSGTTEFDYGADRQRLESEGPIPEGGYWIDPNQMKYMLWYSEGWGNARITIHPFNTTHNFGRGGFFIHGGSIPGSAGCIDLTGNMDNFTRELRQLPLMNCKIILRVQYPVPGDFPTGSNDQAMG